MRIGEQIKNYRKTAGLTQEQVANYLGVSTPAVNKWEKGNTYPDISLLPALARLLKIDMNELFSFQMCIRDSHKGHGIYTLWAVLCIGLTLAFPYALLSCVPVFDAVSTCLLYTSMIIMIEYMLWVHLNLIR